MTVDPAAESFQGLVLRLRGRTGLSQRTLAARAGVHLRSVQAWESGVSYPSAASLRTLIAACVAAHAFSAGRETEEAEALWLSAKHESPRQRPPFESRWFQSLLAYHSIAVEASPRPPREPAHLRRRSQDLGEAPDTLGFVGRAAELAKLSGWALNQHSRVIAILGSGGIGKTMLAARMTREMAPAFDFVYWRSLRNAPTPGEWLRGTLQFLSGEAIPDEDSARLELLIEILREQRCLLVLDNFEALLLPGDRDGGYRDGYAGYGTLLDSAGQREHQSCLVLTTRELPAEVAYLNGAVRHFQLGGLSAADARKLLSDKQLQGDELAWERLVFQYGGNGLALKVVGETIQQVFGGAIATFLNEVGSPTFGGIRHLLDSQIERLSELEQNVLRWLAVEREPGTVADLARDLGSTVRRGPLVEAVEALRRRSLIDWSESAMALTLQPVVLEYLTDRLVETANDELENGHLDVLVSHAFLKAQSKEYVRVSQERLLIAPILDRLIRRLGRADLAIEWLIELVRRQRESPIEHQGYAPGNLVNMVRLVQGNLRHLDLSRLWLQQVFLLQVEAQDATLADARVSDAVFADAFNYPASLALSADGSTLAAGTSTGDVCIWRVADRALTATLRGHSGLITSLALNETGTLLASGSADGTVRVWDVPPGQVRILQVSESGVRGVALSRNATRVVAGGIDGTLLVCGTAGGDLLHSIQVPTGGIWAVAASADGRVLASGSEDGTVRVWDGTTGRLLKSLRGHSASVWGLALSGDGSLLASGSVDRTARLWDTATAETLATLEGHAASVWSIALTSDGQLVATGSEDGTARLWEVQTGQPLAVLQGHSGGIRGVALSDDHRIVATGSFDGTASLWDAASGRRAAMLQGQAAGLWAVALSPNGQAMVSGGEDRVVRLWSADGGQQAAWYGHTALVRCVALAGNGVMIASGGEDATVRLWVPGTPEPFAILRGHAGVIHQVAFSSAGDLVASAGEDGTVRIWKTRDGGSRLTLPAHLGGVYGVALSGDGTLLASGGFDRAIRVWRVIDGQLLSTLMGHSSAVQGVAFSYAGDLIASASYDGTVRLWDVASGRARRSFDGHVGAVRCVALSRDGTVLTSGGFDTTVRVWDASGEQPVRTLRGHTGGVWGVAVSSDGRRAASASADGTARLWDTRSDASLRTFRADRRYERMDITGLTGVTSAQREALLALGAVDRIG